MSEVSKEELISDDGIWDVIRCEVCNCVIRDYKGEMQVDSYFDFDDECVCDECLFDYARQFKRYS